MNETLEILERVNTFYAEAWSQLLLFTIAAISIVGVIVPVLIHIIQSRSIKSEKQAMENLIEMRIGGIREEIFKRMQNEINTEIQAYRDQLEKGIAKAEGGLFHLQGNTFIERGEIVVSTYSMAYAATKYLDAEDECNLRRVLNVITDTCLPKLDISSLTDEYMNNREILDELIKSLAEKNENGRYSDDIRSIKKGLKTALQSDPNHSVNQALTKE